MVPHVPWATMTARQPTPRRWEIDDGGGSHLVELDHETFVSGAPTRFTSDGVQSRFPGNVFNRRRIATFNVGPRAATLVRVNIQPTFRQALARQLAPLRRGLPGIIAAGLLGGEAGAALATGRA